MRKITTEELDAMQFGRVLHKRPETIPAQKTMLAELRKKIMKKFPKTISYLARRADATERP